MDPLAVISALGGAGTVAVEARRPARAEGDKAHRTAVDFEAMVLAQSFEALFRGVKIPSLTGGGFAEELWRSFLLSEYARGAAESGSFGIARQVEAEIRRMQGEAPDPVQPAAAEGPARG
ncbi:rod-binding protein [Inquilinus limosus]|uniref:rod-binding protein n=1 Tax=Inquilinus limosus TaxID=171674 RepID=UPI003F16EBF2